MTEPVIALRDVVKEFGEDVVTRVLHGVEMTVYAGEFVALVGPSGSGKSTLLNMLGLLDRPTSGSVNLVGHETTRLSEPERTRLRAQALGFVFQFHHLISAMSAVQNVMLPLAIDRGRTGSSLRQRALEGLAEVGLEPRADELITKLSGGQQQRVAIARALVRRPPLLLADEPTGNLDTETADTVFRLLRAKSTLHRIACLLVTHDPALAQRCDRVFTLVDGRIVDVREGRNREP
ncbi:MAG: ABC transporter ATP-binding protein [Myxococcales bacterium FL481]|nr:MAG: ABC transporter ATP-binding protein [Myxococcales bacterium FL481]